MPLHMSEEVPVRGAYITLLHGPAVDGYSGSAKFKRAVKNQKETSLALCGVVEAPPHLQGHWAPAADAFNYCFDNRKGVFGLGQQESAAAAAENLFDWTTEIDVNRVITRF